MPDADTAERVLAGLMLRQHPGEAARLLEESPAGETVALLKSAPQGIAAGVLRHLSPDAAAAVLMDLPTALRTRVLAGSSPERAATLVARLSAQDRESILAEVPASLGRELRTLLAYPPETAGALMDPRVTTFRPEATVADVVRRLRRLRAGRVQEAFLLDDAGRLAGAIPLQDILLADDQAPLASLVAAPAPSVLAVAPREEIVQAFEEQRLASLAVVDVDGRLLGVLRGREVMQAAQEQAMASAVTMVGASEHERALSSPAFAIRKRLPWLEFNLLTAFLAASVVGLFEHTIAQVTALAVLLPVVAGQSGNTGAQALAVTLRGLALREVRTRHWARVAGKELAAGAGNGVAVALTTAAAVWVWSRSVGLALVIGLSMVLSMTLAGLAGAAIPMLLTALRQDPAQSSSIVLTTVTDVVGFFSFLGIATALMHML
jgi:magnesium transporter